MKIEIGDVVKVFGEFTVIIEKIIDDKYYFKDGDECLWFVRIDDITLVKKNNLNTNDMERVTNIHVERAKRNLTQAELADQIKVSRQTIISIENGGECGLTIAMKIAEYFKVSVEYLFKKE